SCRRHTRVRRSPCRPPRVDLAGVAEAGTATPHSASSCRAFAPIKGRMRADLSSLSGPMIRSARKLVLGALMILAAASVLVPGTALAGGPRGSTPRRIMRAHPVVPVLAESGGSLLRERQRGARVRIYAVRRGG